MIKRLLRVAHDPTYLRDPLLFRASDFWNNVSAIGFALVTVYAFLIRFARGLALQLSWSSVVIRCAGIGDTGVG